MRETSTDTTDRIDPPLTVRPELSRAALRFVETHPDAAQRVVAKALETAAALDAAGVPVALQRFVTSTHADFDAWRLVSISEAAELLEVTRITVYAWIEAKRLVAWRATRRGVLVPAEQILGPGEVVPGIEQVLAIISDSAAAWDFLTEESPYIDPDGLRRPIDSLKAGKIESVIAAAHSLLEAFT